MDARFPASNPFPGDPAGRAWIEAAGANPSLIDQFRPSLVAFVAFDRGQSAHLVGTGFVICGSADFALVITAKHVLEGVAEIQCPAHQAKLKLGAKNLRAILDGVKGGGVSARNTRFLSCLYGPGRLHRRSTGN
jgi:hypothetical protein